MSEELIHVLEQDIKICRATGNELREKRMIEIIRRLKQLDVLEKEGCANCGYVPILPFVKETNLEG